MRCTKESNFDDEVTLLLIRVTTKCSARVSFQCTYLVTISGTLVVEQLLQLVSITLPFCFRVLYVFFYVDRQC